MRTLVSWVSFNACLPDTITWVSAALWERISDTWFLTGSKILSLAFDQIGKSFGRVLEQLIARSAIFAMHDGQAVRRVVGLDARQSDGVAGFREHRMGDGRIIMKLNGLGKEPC